MIKSFLASQSDFTKNVLTLVSGAVFAQGVSVLIIPILTRLYTPQDFGGFAVILSITSVLSVFATGRYQFAILLPKNKKNAARILQNIFIISLFFSFILSVIIFFFREKLSKILSIEDASWHLMWVPIFVLLFSNFQSISVLLNREKKYKRLSEARITNAMLKGGGQVGFGYIWGGGLGLIIGHLMGLFFSLLWIFPQAISSMRGIKLSKKNFILLKKYRRFPQILAFAHALNAVYNQGVPIVLSATLGVGVVGLFDLANRVVRVPMFFIGSSVAEVFRQEASDHFRIHRECRSIYLQTLVKLIKISLLPTLMIGVSAPFFFELVFGAEWKDAGSYVQALIPFMFFQFLSSPLSSMYMIAEKQKEDFLFQILFASGSLISLILGSSIGGFEAVFFYSITCGLLHFINLFLSFRFACGK